MTYGPVEHVGASPSFSSSHHSCCRHRKVSIGVTVQEALTRIDSVIKRKNETGDSCAEHLAGKKNMQEDTGRFCLKKNIQEDRGRLSLKNGQVEASIQKAGAWVSRSFQKESKTVEFYANRPSVLQSGNGISKKVHCVTYARKSKDEVNPEKLEEFAFTATQEMQVSSKREVNNKTVIKENEKFQTNQCTESLRVKLWDILQSVPSQGEDNKDAKIPKTKQNSDTIETDSEKPVQNVHKPVIHSTLQRKPTYKYLKAQNGLKPGQLPPSLCAQPKLPKQSVFMFTGEEGHELSALGINRHSFSFKRKPKKKCSLIAPRRIQYSPETILEEKPEDDRQKEILHSPLLSPKETANAESLRSPQILNNADRGVLVLPVVTKEKDNAQSDLATTLPRQSSTGKPVHQSDVNVIKKSPAPKDATVEESSHRSCKNSLVKEKIQIGATMKKRLCSPQKSPSHRFGDVVEKNSPFPKDAAVEEGSVCRSQKYDTGKENFQIGINKNKRFCSPQRSTMHRFDVDVLENLPTLKDAAVEKGGFNMSWKCDVDKERVQTGTMKKKRFPSPQGSPTHRIAAEFENSPVPKDAATEEGNIHRLRRHELDKGKFQADATREGSFHSPAVCNDNVDHTSPEIPENMAIAEGFFRHRRHSFTCVASSDDTTEGRKTCPKTPHVSGKKDVEKNSFPCSVEKHNDECSDHCMTKREKWTSKGHKKPLFLLHHSISVHHQANFAKSPSPVLQSTKGKKENSQYDVTSQQSEDALARAITQFASGLERFKTKMKSHTRKKTSDILSGTIEKIQAQLQSAESQIHTELEKLVNLSKTKRRKLETRFQGQQERLQAIQEKFKEDVSLHLQECKDVLGEMDADQIELRAVAERQKASHRKLLLQVEAEMQVQLGDAERRIAYLRKEARKKMQELKDVLGDVF